MKRTTKLNLLGLVFLAFIIVLIGYMNWRFGLFLSIYLVSHEFGHYLLAKKRGLFDGFEINVFPSVKLKQKFPCRWDYLSGFVGAMLSFPVFVLLQVDVWWLFFCFSLFGAALDILVVIFYDKIKA